MAEKGRVAWCLSTFDKGSGGLNTVFKNAEALWEAGFKCDLYFLPRAGLPVSEELLRSQISDWYGFSRPFELHVCATELEGGYDLAIATFWDTAPFVAASDARHKAYFVQDWEPYFYAVDGSYLEASSTYHLGLRPITIGNWLAQKCTELAGVPATPTPFCADSSIYRPISVAKERAVCAIYQPDKPRRASGILVDALRIFRKLHPDATVYLFGSKSEALPEEEGFVNLGLLSMEQCNELYNKCACGVSMSTTNPSRIPFEMMAAGLPVVDLYGENTLFDLPSPAVTLASPDAASLATAIGRLFEDDDLRIRASQAGLDFMAERNISLEQSDFVAACEDILSGAATVGFASAPKLQTSRIEAGQREGELSLQIWREGLEARAAECRPYALADHEVKIVVDTPRPYHLVKLAVWSDPGQADLRWLDMRRESENGNRWVYDCASLSLDSVPKPFQIHVYVSETEEFSEHLAWQIGRNLYFDDGASSSTSFDVGGLGLAFEPVLGSGDYAESESLPPEPSVEQPRAKRRRHLWPFGRS